MKRGLLGFPLLVLLMQVVNAQFFGGYGRFSITDFFSSIDSQTMILSLLFFIFFALIYYVLSRVFKNSYGEPNKGVAGTISLAVSLLIVYGIYQSGFNIGDLFYNLGVGAEILYLIGSIIFIILVIFLIKKIGFRGFLIVFGLLLILLTIFTDIFYEKGLVTAIGIVLLLFGLLLWRRSRRIMRGVGRGAWKVGRGIAKRYDWEKEKRQAKAIGRGISAPFKAVRKYRDPGHRLLRYREKREAAVQRRVTKRTLAHEKAAYKEDKRMHPGAIRRTGRGVGRFAQREWQKEKNAMQERGIRREERKLRRAEKVLQREEARRQKAAEKPQKVFKFKNTNQ